MRMQKHKIKHSRKGGRRWWRNSGRNKINRGWAKEMPLARGREGRS